jgi:hypothetical protein
MLKIGQRYRYIPSTPSTDFIVEVTAISHTLEFDVKIVSKGPKSPYKIGAMFNRQVSLHYWEYLPGQDAP